MMDNAQKRNICTHVPSSQTFDLTAFIAFYPYKCVAVQPEGGGSVFLRNVSTYKTALCHRLENHNHSKALKSH
jgi:hypothetical protein